MVLQKILPASRNLIAKRFLPIRSGCASTRNYSHYNAPTERNSFQTKLVWAAIYVTGVCAVPFWVIANLDSYQGKREE